MKIILLLAIFCAVSYASISPKWIDANDGPSKNFNWTEVTVQSQPVKGEWNTINYCGVAHENLNYTYFSYKVGLNLLSDLPTVYKSGSVVLQGDRTSFAGASDCEFFNFQVPDFDGSKFYVTLNLYAFEKNETYYDFYQSSIEIEFEV